MSRKVLKSMKDESPDLQKQIGCINGFFQLFDRHRFLTGQRTSSQSPDRPTRGGSSNHIKELGSTKQKAMAKNLKVAREKQQFSTESSITSMSSSSCSSSMSSLEFNRTVQVEPPSIAQIKFSENLNSRAAMKQLDTPGQQSLDLRDMFQDSKLRKAQGLSVKTVAKEGKKGHTLKYIDSPRPLQPPKSVDKGVMVASEPFHVLAKSQKTPWDSSRLSYDGRDIQDTFKSTVKQKELPRLSLDSREGSIRSFNEATRSHNLLKGQSKGYGSSSTMVNLLQEPETSKRQSSVVAKLMGLEAFPDCTQTCEISIGTLSCSTTKKEPLARPSTSDEYKQHQSSGSPRTCKGSTLLQSERADSITNVTSYSRSSLESTPWRQPDASQGSKLPVSKGRESSTKASSPSHSVYGEIEKRLAELEFKKSGKDLRALKQILEAMQRYKDSLDITRDQASNCPSGNRNNSRPNESSTMQSPRNRQKDSISVTVEMSNSSQGSKLPIVIMKPSKVKRKTNSPASTEMPTHGKSGLSKFRPGNPTNGRLVDKQTAKSTSPTIRHLNDPFIQPPRSADKSEKMRTSKLMQSSKISQDTNGENISSGNKTGTESPRVQKKFGLETRSLPTSPSSYCNYNRRQHNRQSIELSSPGTTPRQKFSTLQEANERFSKISCPSRDFKHNIDAISPDFESNKNLATRSGIKVIHTDQSEKISSTSFQLHGLNQNIAAKELNKESSMAETIVTAEQPSPVSVLDDAFYRDDPPSPVKKKSEISKDSDETLNADDDGEQSSADLSHFTNTTQADLSNGTSDRDLNTQNLVQILRQIDCTHEKPIHFNEPLCDRKDPDHKYISEILLASGLLSGPSSSQTFQSPTHLINAKLFLVLEQIKTNKLYNIEDSAKTNEKMQRKLIFDVVCDILVQKLTLESSSSQWFLPNVLASRKLRGQKLLGELCSEIDKLQSKNNEGENLISLLWGDLTHHPTIWTNCYSEIPDIVLNIERLIFKDLITEVVRGEIANHPGKHCRQLLFLK